MKIVIDRIAAESRAERCDEDIKQHFQTLNFSLIISATDNDHHRTQTTDRSEPLSATIHILSDSMSELQIVAVNASIEKR